MAGKLPWKVEWPAKWQAIGVTVEGAGKDHMSKGGSHDIASEIAKNVLHYPVPYPLPYEWFLIGGRKMSSSKGVGASARDMLDILPPVLLRFLMVRTKINQAINFDPSGDTIPKLFDEYQKAADAYFTNTDEDLARIFSLSQIGEIKRPPQVRFSVLAQWVQMPSMQEEIKKQGLEEWAKYAKVWLEKYAPESEKFFVQERLPESAKQLASKQKSYLQKIAEEIGKEWTAETFQKEMYEWAKSLDLSPKESFSAIYQTLLGKDHGPKAAWLILSLDKNFVKQRFTEAAQTHEAEISNGHEKLIMLNKPELFSINPDIKETFPSLSVGVAIIKGVTIEKSHPELEKEKQKLLTSLEQLTTETLSTYPEILSYRRLYKAMGIDWHSRRPSPEALLRRVALKKGLYAINTCVDAYNLVVMQHRVSIGAFDLDKIAFPTELRFAKMGEDILLLGDTEPTQYKENELAYFDQQGGYNIDFNYRDSQRTAVQLETKNLYINVDGIYDIAPQKVAAVLQEACDNIIKYCGGTLETFGVETAA
jgi:lysyl-tRNA synthetase class 1